MFQSMQNMFTFMNEFHRRFGEQMGNIADNVGVMRKNLNIKSGTPKAPLDIYSILGAALSIVSAGGTPLAGPTAGLSGIMYLVSGVSSSDASTDDAVEATAEFQGLVSSVSDEGMKAIDGILGATFGKQGYAQSGIPEPMRLGDAKYKNPAVQVFGWGAWLRDDALDGLDDTISHMRSNMVS
jgi:hypothetical protein